MITYRARAGDLAQEVFYLEVDAVNDLTWLVISSFYTLASGPLFRGDDESPALFSSWSTLFPIFLFQFNGNPMTL